MDLNQRKLIKAEWNSIEVPVSESEKQILKLIIEGYNNVNITMNFSQSISSYLKIEHGQKFEDFIYIKYLKDRCDKIQQTACSINVTCPVLVLNTNTKLNSADRIRFEKNNEELIINKKDLYDNVIVYHLEKFLHYFKKNNEKQFSLHYYTIHKLLRNNIAYLNCHLRTICNYLMDSFNSTIQLNVVIEYADELIEKNKNLLKYDDLSLYDHQKEIFNCVRRPGSKLILYIAPTGTGKTLTPLALSEQFKIIFVCAARHVGLALAKAAISTNKKVAFAFGCASADDIRLHYFSAKEYGKNKRTGGIGKVDNSVGDNVEIMICDIKSYLYAMYYMRSFNMDENGNDKHDNIITYWDEPTITLDYDNHEFHSIIKDNWKNNLIQNIVLSSATLPKCEELTETIADFRAKFPNASICNINSYDCKKSIPLINKDGYVVLPHYISDDYDKIVEIANYCEQNLTLLRYFDLKEICNFITFVNKNNYISPRFKLDKHFESIGDVNMKNIKIYYLLVLKNIFRGLWGAVYTTFKTTRVPRLRENSGVDSNGNKITKIRRLDSDGSGSPVQPSANVGLFVTTKDSYSLTDGPTIFISNEIEKIAKFCIQQANIPAAVMDDLVKRISFNNTLNEKINTIEQSLDYATEQFESQMKNVVDEKHGNMKIQGRNKSTNSRMFNREGKDTDMNSIGNITLLTNEINGLRSMIKYANLNEVFVPNKSAHLKKWASDIETTNPYTANIDEQIVNEIMLLHGVEDSWKVLLMMGIGVFINHTNPKYTEIMKNLADQQQLYMIIASSDYIYGTNYQFCHGYLSKDLKLSQDKIIQALGRIGRNNIQQDYSIRFRDDNHINQLFVKVQNKPEVINMNILFNSNNIKWDGSQFVPDEK
jgi:hypothetical protein